MGGGAVRWEVGRALRTFGSGSSVLLFFATRKARERRFGPVAGPGAHAEGWEPAARRRGRTQSGSEAIGLDSMRALAAAKRWFLSRRERSAAGTMVTCESASIKVRDLPSGASEANRGRVATTTSSSWGLLLLPLPLLLLRQQAASSIHEIVERVPQGRMKVQDIVSPKRDLALVRKGAQHSARSLPQPYLRERLARAALAAGLPLCSVCARVCVCVYIHLCT